jgi:hypothetical protein
LVLAHDTDYILLRLTLAGPWIPTQPQPVSPSQVRSEWFSHTQPMLSQREHSGPSCGAGVGARMILRDIVLISAYRGD